MVHPKLRLYEYNVDYLLIPSFFNFLTDLKKQLGYILRDQLPILYTLTKQSFKTHLQTGTWATATYVKVFCNIAKELTSSFFKINC